MGFADLTIAELADDYQLDIETIIALCHEQGIPFRNEQSLLSLEDAKTIIGLATSVPRS